MICIYFLGGPWDLHKVAYERPPQDDRITMRAIESGGVWLARGEAEAKVVDHVYHVRKQARDLFIAIHEPTYLPEWRR